MQKFISAATSEKINNHQKVVNKCDISIKIICLWIPSVTVLNVEISLQLGTEGECEQKGKKRRNRRNMNS